jgi:regulatory protein
MKISNLTQNKNISLVDVYVDDEFFTTVDKNMVLELGLAKGQALTSDDLASLKLGAIFNKLYNFALSRILARPRSESEIRQYLSGKSDNEEVISSVIRKLIDAKYIDDLAFAQWWIDSRNTFRAKSRVEISHELSLKGIDREIITQAINSDMPIDIEKDNVVKLVEKKWSLLQSQNGDFQEKRKKLIAYLMRKGFNWDSISEAIKDIQ